MQNDGKSLTAAGKFYFDQVGKEFSPLNVDQPEIRRRRTKYMKMLNGTEKAIARFDNVSLEWRLTRLGKQVYAQKRVKYMILWPTFEIIPRINGSLYKKKDVLQSTATDLGEIEVPGNLSEAEQLEKVREREARWRNTREEMDGGKVLLAGYHPHVFRDDGTPIEYNKLEISSQGGVDATLHRPLRNGKPTLFHDIQNVSEHSAQDTNGNCVSYGLSKHIRFKTSNDCPFSQQQLHNHLMEITQTLYKNDPESPYDGKADGFTAVAIEILRKERGLCLHVKIGQF